MGDLVSVVMPFKNCEDSIATAARSILDQTYSDLELIAVNDNSTDSSGDIIQSIDNQKLILLNSNGNGIVDALNTGIAASRGRLIARMDADDFSYPDRIWRQVDYLNKHPEVGVASCAVDYEGDRNQFEGYFRHVQWLNGVNSPEEIYLARFQDSPVAHPSVVFRKELADRHGGYKKGDFPEDYELWLRWMHFGVKFGKVNAPLLAWRDNPKRLSRIHPNYSEEAFFRIKARFLILWASKKFKRKPVVYVWGTGTAVKRKSKWVEDCGLPISAYIDVKPRLSFNGKPVVEYGRLHERRCDLILVFVSDRQGKTMIRDYLKENGWREGADFLLMA